MSKFKVGDRVAVYGFRPDRAGSATRFFSRGERGKVEEIVAPDEVLVQFDDGTDGEVHPKQCRKLKQKRELRRAWINLYGSGQMGCTYESKEDAQKAGGDSKFECLEFIEVRRKK